MLARSEDPAVQHPAAQVVLAGLQHLEVDEPVVDGDPVARLHLVHHVLVVDVDAPLLGVLGGGDGDVELLADLEGQVPQAVAGANGGPLQIGEQGDGVVQAFVEVLDGPD